MPTNCWCEGTNENCAWCGGSGIRAEHVVFSREPRRRSKRKGRKTPRSQQTAPLPERPGGSVSRVSLASSGPLCEPNGGRSYSFAHLPPVTEKRQGARPRSADRLAASSSLTDRSATRAQRSARAVEARSAGPVQVRIVGDAAGRQVESSSDARKQLVRCSRCGSMVRATRLKGHIRKVHGHGGTSKAGPGKSLARSAQKKPGRMKERIPIHDRSIEPPERESRAERIMDGSREFWRAYREHGRFGSHASYDDYGEESSV